MNAKLRDMGDFLLGFHCPGCKHDHGVQIKGSKREPIWGWNGSLELPTFTPSIFVNRSVPGRRCHSHVTAGNIQFLADCDHALAGQTVPLPDWEAW
jgi:hypothetical protein